MSVGSFSELSTEEKQALSQARAYHLRTVQSQLRQLSPVPPFPGPPHRPGVHVTTSHRQGFTHYCTARLWSNEEALYSRAALQRWCGDLHLPHLATNTVVAQGLTRPMATAVPPATAGGLLPRILSGDAGARITAAELKRVEREAIGVFSLSYRHEGPKGRNISARLWTDVVTVASAVAASAGFRAYSLWIDCVSAAAAQRDVPAADYIDWFSVGVAPYLLLPALLVATGRDYRSRTWLRMEEKLSQYGVFCVYALRSAGAIVRLEPGPTELRGPYERIWCLCQSVVRGEYNGLAASYREDYLNLLEWATEFDQRPLNFRGLQRVFGELGPTAFRDTLPIETGSYVVLPLLPRMPWLHGAEAFAGRVEYVAEKDVRPAATAR
ncbi:unnamed protein product [Chondrus crispus]|uniref:Uncharacterized protein n=1 Tax=Chondrus crispus TaxID=2769 RepID=R7Q805_CHOCR|nr:unnamed protein product [Chondrus crispus]CDF34169.1 unnamed protein product [Chondrus crispus]|eukprot:XP_005713988.1 unnamed protein product [Chondrus crispus]